MKQKKKLLAALLVLCVVEAVAVAWLLMNYHVVGFKLYSKDAAAFDLRGKTVRIRHYEALQEKMPEATILWDVPLHSHTFASNARQITVTSLTEGDVETLDYLQRLETVDGRDCSDYAQLYALQLRRPEVEVLYDIPVGGQVFAQDTSRVELDSITAGEIEVLQYLPQLETVVFRGGETVENVAQLQQFCRESGIGFRIAAGGIEVPDDAREVTLGAVTDAELELLAFLPDMERLHMEAPAASPEKLTALRDAYPDADITWEVEIAGETFLSTDTEVDLSTVVIEDLAAVEAAMAYLTDAETLILGLCGIDDPTWGNSEAKGIAASKLENEELAAYRDRVREDYKVVWTVRLGPNIALRTDKDNFMPGHFGVGRLFDDHAYNLRYCEDMICLDLGHMTLRDVSFLEFMPDLEYLILAHTEVQYIDAISNCKKLKFLELDWSCVKDLTPLQGCTALEDLNIGKTWVDITPVLEMTWLKHLYMIFCNGADAWQCTQTLTETRVVASGTATVASGWRRLPNYYAMRDALGMYYMN